MTDRPLISLIVPTRQRLPRLQRLLESLATTTTHPAAVEIVLVIDEDDAETRCFEYEELALRQVIVPPGLTMGALNMAGYEASAGRYLMLLNDDVIARTSAWDERVRDCFRDFPDEVALVHVNDLLFRQSLCTFPLVTRTYCELAGGVCPPEYVRYRIDDHIGDVFNLLTLLDERRTVYLPDVVFEHLHYEENRSGERRYASDPAIMALDAPRFEALRSERKELALRLKEHIDERSRRAIAAQHRRNLDGVAEPFALRAPQRLRVRGDSPDLERARVTVGMIVDADDETSRLSRSAIRRYTPGVEIVTVEPTHPGEGPGRAWNRLLRMTTSDYLVVLSDRVQVGPAWLPGLLRGLRGGAAIVTPLFRAEGGGPIYAGLAAAPQPDADPSTPRRLLTLSGEMFLLDTARCRDLVADERYDRYFADLDLGLRAWELGLPVAGAPSAVVSLLRPRPLPPDAGAVREQFDHDRRLFADAWRAGKCCLLPDECLAVPFRSLHRMLDLAPEVMHLLWRGRRECLIDYARRAARVFDEARLYPVLPQLLVDVALQALRTGERDIHDPQTGHLAWLLGLSGWPVEVEPDYRGYRIVLCGDFLAVPAKEGPFDLGRYRRGDYSQTHAAEDVEILKREIDTALADRMSTAVRQAHTTL
jgi:GT2 family glycosyltransferase